MSFKIIGQGEVNPAKDQFDPRAYITDQNRLRRMDLVSQYAVVAAYLAIKDAKLDLDNLNLDRVGVVLEVGWGAIQTTVNYYKGIINDGIQFASPFLLPNTVLNMPAGQIALEFGFRGVNSTLSSKVPAMDSAMEYARILLETDKADVILAGIAQEKSEILVGVEEGAKISIMGKSFILSLELYRFA